jgi:protein involved in polysaccharide export with SLBB domain
MSLALLLSVAAYFAGPQGVSAASGYRIQAGDQLDVKLYYNSDLNETVTVRPDGAISLQLIGELRAAGATPGELSATLKTEYGKQLRDPEVTVIVRAFAAQRVYVDGEIGKPGVVEIPGQMTLMQALAAAGGAKRTARLSEIVIIRYYPEKGRRVLTADLRRAASPDHPAAADSNLQPLDVVFVPRTRIANVNNWVDLYIKNNLPVTFGIFASPF